ncbi:MAG: hypothetical protein OXH56_06685 [Gemmatimonadetes bacterium]|nr:hypothetical protein [Gemmatimonadota bacterium]
MARDPGGLLVKKAAETGDREAIAEAAAERAFNLVDGWPAAFSVDAFPKRETFNQLIYIITAAITDIFMHGVAEWHTDQAYEHPALVFGSDNQLYASLQSSGGSLPSRNPAQTASRTGYWTLFSATGATGPAGPRGPRGPTGPQGPAGGSASVALASDDEVEAGSLTTKAVTPAALLGALFKASVNARWRADTAGYGLVRIGTLAEIQGTNADRVVTGQTLGQMLVNASATVRGLVELATNAEAKAGTDTARAVTPRGLKEATPNASETVRGLVELATTSEATTGTDTSRAVTPAGLKAAVQLSAVKIGSSTSMSSHPGFANFNIAGTTWKAYDFLQIKIVESVNINSKRAISTLISTDLLDDGETTEIAAFRTVSETLITISSDGAITRVSGTERAGTTVEVYGI